MTGFANGAYIDEERVVHNADGSPDELGRYVDERGYVHLSDGNFDEHWFVDAHGQPHDGHGMPSGETLGIPQSWTVHYEPAEETLAWPGAHTEPGDHEAMEDAALKQQAAERRDGLSDTEATHPSDAAQEAFAARLVRPDEAPYTAGYTTEAAERKPAYVDEDINGARFGDPNSDRMTTTYQDRSTIGQRASSVDNQGRVLDTSGQLVPDGRWGWVIDEETGFLMLFDPARVMVVNYQGVERAKRPDESVIDLLIAGYKIRYTHHTTPVAGMPVTGAGLMRIESGFIAELTDESGHYRPEAPQQYAALQAMMDEGYSLEQAKVRLTGRTMEGGRPSDKTGWIDQAKQRNPDFPTDDVMLRPEQFMQTQGDEYQIRLKQAANAEIRRNPETPPAAEGVRTGRGPATASTTTAAATTTAGTTNARTDQSAATAAPPAAASATTAGTTNATTAQRTVQPTSNAEGYRSMVRDDDAAEVTGYRPMVRDDDAGDYSDSDSDDDDQPADGGTAAFVQQARDYLHGAGSTTFADWFRNQSPEHQNLLVADPDIASAVRPG